MTPIVGLFLGLVALADDPPATLPPAASRPVDFARDVRPILAASCAGCHGAKKRKGGLSLEGKAEALAGGDEGPAIVPGHGAESRLIRYVAGLDEDHAMPPEGSGERLTSDQVGILRGWIDQGATWPDEAGKGPAGADHWSFKPPVRPPLPEVRDPSWPRNPIDRFVLARLEKDGLRPSPEADRVTLIRRLSLDLIGLPPTIAEVDAFVADGRPDAYERQVDRLLASPHYGERWARRWLDGARYADTNGYEKDRERSIWPYRDWVIRALDADLPFDRFTVEQVAGDLLPGATEAQVVATGFHRNTMINEEGGIDVEEFRFASLVDRVATTGAVWLGLTVQCAQCHTHKYDPITQREYYRLLAFFDNADEPDLDLADPAVAARRAEVGRKIADLEAALPSRFPDEDPRLGWSALMPSSVNRRIRREAHDPARRLRSPPPAPRRTRTATTSRPRLDLTNVTAIRLEALTDPDLPKSGPGRAPNGNFVLTDLEFASLAPVDGSEPRPVAFASAEADVAQAGFPVNQAIDGKPETGWAVDAGAGQLNRDHSATFVLAGKPPGRGPDPAPTSGSPRITAASTPSAGSGSRPAAAPSTRPARPPRLAAATGSPPGRPSGRPRSGRPAGRSGRRAWSSPPRGRPWTCSTTGRSSPRATSRTTTPTASRSRPTAGRSRRSASKSSPTRACPTAGPAGPPCSRSATSSCPRPRWRRSGRIGPRARWRSPRPRPTSPSRRRPLEGVLDGKLDTGWSVGGAVGKPHALVFRLAEPLGPSPGSRLVLTLKQAYIHQTTIGRFRVSTTNDADPPAASGLPAEVEAVALIPRADRTAGQAAVLDRHFLAVAPELAGANEEIAALRRGDAGVPDDDGDARASPLAGEDDPCSPPRRVPPPGRPRLAGDPGRADPPAPGRPGRPPGVRPLAGRREESAGRAGRDEPGLAGVLRPGAGRHPRRLRDPWGAADATRSCSTGWPTSSRRRGWSQKAMHRLIVTSATYRQSSAVAADLLALDPRNERLARGPRFRVDAETVRDIALSAAGLLDGDDRRSERLPAPARRGVLARLRPGRLADEPGCGPLPPGPLHLPEADGPVRRLRRPSTCPSSETACVRRERSNTPLQALTLLNDPAFVEAARALGRRVVAEGPATPRAGPVRLPPLRRASPKRCRGRADPRLPRPPGRADGSGPATSTRRRSTAATPPIPTARPGRRWPGRS